jgi:hypothetical protein
VAVDHPLVTVAHGSGGEQRGVGPGAGLGHGEGGPELAVEERAHPALLLLLRAPLGQQLAVAGVRGVVAEDRRGVDAAPEDLVHEAQAHLAEPAAAELLREVGGPQALGLDLLLQRIGDAAQRVVVEVEGLEGLDLLAHEAAHPLELLLELGLGREVPGHGGTPTAKSDGRARPY